MAVWKHVARFCRFAFAVVVGCAYAYSSLRAELLSTYFPEGVPGYGTDPGVTVSSRARPEFDPQGIRVNSFVVHPQLEQGLGYDSNVFGGTPQRGSWVVGTHPSVLVTSDWSRDSLGGFLAVDDTRYLDQPAQSTTNWTGSVGSTVAVGRDQLTVSAAHFALHQSRTDLDALPSDTPVGYQVDDVRASYAIALNRLSVTPSLAYSVYRYDATTIFGAPTSQTYRNRDVLQGAVTSRYEIEPQRNLVVVIRALDSDYVAPQPGTPSRNSTGYQMLAGLADDSDAVWRYRALLGWEIRDFAASQYKAHEAPIAEVAVIWSPSGMTTVTGTLSRSIEDAAQEGIVGYTFTSARLVLDHEYLRNVLVQVSTGMQRADYLQGGGQSTGVTLGGGATWLLNRHMRLAATYDFTDQRGSSNSTLMTTGNYARSLGMLTLRLGM